MANTKSLNSIKNEIVNLVADNKLKEAKGLISNLIDAIKSVDELSEVRATIEKVHLADSGIKPKEDLIKIYDKIVSCIKSNDYITAKKYIAETKKGVKFKKDVEVNLIKSVEKLVELFYDDNQDGQTTEDNNDEEVEDVSNSKIFEDSLDEIVESLEISLNDRKKLGKIILMLKKEIITSLNSQDVNNDNFSCVIKCILKPIIYCVIDRIGLDNYKGYMKSQLQIILSEEATDDDIVFLHLLKKEFNVDSEELLDDVFANIKSIRLLTDLILNVCIKDEIIKSSKNKFYQNNDPEKINQELTGLLYGVSAIDYLSEFVTKNVYEPANKYVNKLISEIGTTNILLKNPKFMDLNAGIRECFKIDDEEFIESYLRMSLKECVINKSDDDVKAFFEKYKIVEKQETVDENPTNEIDESNPYADILAILK